MLKRFSELQNIQVRTFDRTVGQLSDLLIDEQTWFVRYLVVAFDNTLPKKRRVLVSPAVVERFDFDLNVIAIGLDSQQLIDSPQIDHHRPISRQYEQALVDYYGWPIYWLGRVFHGSSKAMERLASDFAKDFRNQNESSNLRSVGEICGYNIYGKDGHAGYLKDLVVHTETWEVEYATADPSSWLPKEKTMFSCTWIDSVNRNEKRIDVDLAKATLEKSNKAIKHNASITGEPLSAQPYRM